MSDLIDRQKAIRWVKTECNPYGKPTIDFESGKKVIEHLEQMPSAQPEKEIAKRVLWTGWKGHRDTRYKCPNCKKPVKNDDIYCHRCGQRLMFSKISFTPYVEGQKQEVIVRWDDEG